MYLSDLLAGLRRRWYALLLGLTLTALLCVGAIRITPVEYVAQSSVLLLPPATTVGTGGNPYLALGGLQGAADVLARAMSGDEISQEIAPPSGTATYTFQPDATTNGPMLVIEVRDISNDGALATLDSLLIKSPEVLKDLQVKVAAPEDSLIRIGTITRPVDAEPDSKAQLRSLIVALAVGVAITLFGTTLLDGYLLRRRARNDVSDASAGRMRPSSTPRSGRSASEAGKSSDPREPALVQPRSRALRMRTPQGKDREGPVARSE